MKPTLRIVLSLSALSGLAWHFHTAGWFMEGGALSAVSFLSCILLVGVALEAVMTMIGEALAPDGPNTSE